MIKASCKICGFEKEFQDKFACNIFKCPSCTAPVKIELNDFIEEAKKEI
jgi:predicted Zn-ribbon and HTH transcriptional regulator